MKIIELELLTDNLLQTEKFYSEIMDFTLINKNKLSISFLIGSTKLTFVQTNNQNPVYHFAFNIPNNKIEEALDFINSKVEVMEVAENSNIADFIDWNAKSIYFKDNNGNILELISRFDIDNKSDRVYDNSLIQCVSEIGISTANVLEECKKLITNYPLGYFSKQTPQDNFAAIGDDNGLIIFSKNRRHWFPTDHPSEKYWTKIKFECKEKTYEIEYHKN